MNRFGYLVAASSIGFLLVAGAIFKDATEIRSYDRPPQERAPDLAQELANKQASEKLRRAREDRRCKEHLDSIEYKGNYGYISIKTGQVVQVGVSDGIPYCITAKSDLGGDLALGRHRRDTSVNCYESYEETQVKKEQGELVLYQRMITSGYRNLHTEACQEIKRNGMGISPYRESPIRRSILGTRITPRDQCELQIKLTGRRFHLGIQPETSKFWVKTRQEITLRDVARQLGQDELLIEAMNQASPNSVLTRGQWIVLPSEAKRRAIYTAALDATEIRRTPPPKPSPCKDGAEVMDQ